MSACSRDDTAEDDPLCEWRVPSVGDNHVGFAALRVGADVHVHEGLSPAGPARDLDQVFDVGVQLEVPLRVDHLLVHVELEAA